MKRKMMIRIALPIFFVAVFFQNCSMPMSASRNSEGDIPDGQKLIGTASEFDHIVLALDPQNANQPSFHLDLANGHGAIKQADQNLKSCDVPADALSEIKSILDSSGICEPGPLPEGTAACLALGISDIQLSSSSDQLNVVELRPVVCHSGTFLCNGLDKPFRETLRRLADNCL